MSRYIARRLISVIPVVLGVLTLVFSLVHLVPGDAAMVIAGPWATQADVEAIRSSLHLDQPLYVQYLIYLGNLLHGDLGRSNMSGLPVAKEIAARFPTTIILTLTSMAFAVTVGSLLGVLSAVRHHTALDYISSVAAVVGLSLPSFWLGLMLILLFAENLRWLPSMGIGTPAHYILPSLTLGAAVVGMLARMMRATLLDVMSEDYVRTARAKGLHEAPIMYRHIVRNYAIPMITVIGLRIGYLLGGSMVVEAVFALPGLGRLMVEAVLNRDFPMVQGGVLVISLCFVLINLIVDLLYSVLDPRIRVQA